MARKGADHNRGSTGDEQARPPDSKDDVLLHVGAAELREVELRRPSFGGYRRDDVDDLLERAARTIENLVAKVVALEGEIAALQVRHTELEALAARPVPRSDEQVVGELLVTAHRAAESLIDRAEADGARILAEARDRVAPILADAERERDEAGRLRREAEATVEGARRQSTTLVEMARAEREQLLTDALGDLKLQRAELEAERARLDKAAKDLRRGWAGFMTEALARLDGPVEDGEEVDDSVTGDVVIDLHSRLPDGTTGAAGS